jgi:hypothetical protein
VLDDRCGMRLESDDQGVRLQHEAVLQSLLPALNLA